MLKVCRIYTKFHLVFLYNFFSWFLCHPGSLQQDNLKIACLGNTCLANRVWSHSIPHNYVADSADCGTVIMAVKSVSFHCLCFNTIHNHTLQIRLRPSLCQEQHMAASDKREIDRICPMHTCTSSQPLPAASM